VRTLQQCLKRWRRQLDAFARPRRIVLREETTSSLGKRAAPAGQPVRTPAVSDGLACRHLIAQAFSLKPLQHEREESKEREAVLEAAGSPRSTLVQRCEAQGMRPEVTGTRIHSSCSSLGPAASRLLRVSEGNRTLTSWFTARHAVTATPQTPCRFEVITQLPCPVAATFPRQLDKPALQGAVASLLEICPLGGGCGSWPPSASSP
jgi:hypothetical protein